MDTGCSTARNTIECYLGRLCPDFRPEDVFNCGDVATTTRLATTTDFMAAHYLREAEKNAFCDGEGQRFESACEVLDYVCYGRDASDLTYCEGEITRFKLLLRHGHTQWGSQDF